MTEKTTSTEFLDRRLRRSHQGKWVAGVCSGIEKAYGIDAALLRVLLVLATLMGFGAGVLLYLICWAVMPAEDRTTDQSGDDAASPGTHPTGPVGDSAVGDTPDDNNPDGDSSDGDSSDGDGPDGNTPVSGDPDGNNPDGSTSAGETPDGSPTGPIVKDRGPAE